MTQSISRKDHLTYPNPFIDRFFVFSYAGGAKEGSTLNKSSKRRNTRRYRIGETWRYVLGKHTILGFAQFIGFLSILVFQEDGQQTPITVLASFVFALFCFFGAGPTAASHACRRTTRDRRDMAYYASYVLQTSLCITFLAFLYREKYIASLQLIPYISTFICLSSIGVLMYAIVPDSAYPTRLNG